MLDRNESEISKNSVRVSGCNSSLKLNVEQAIGRVLDLVAHSKEAICNHEEREI